MKCFDFADGLQIQSRRLPHWRQAGVTYFVTLRTADSLPAERVRSLELERKCWLDIHEKPYSREEICEYYCLFSERVQQWLDAGWGECGLGRPDCAQIMASALGFFDGVRYVLDDWVVMPNHVHVILTPKVGSVLGRIIHSWTSFTANRVNALFDRQGTFWQREAYDHIVRNPNELERIREYIRQNPVKAGLRHFEASFRP